MLPEPLRPSEDVGDDGKGGNGAVLVPSIRLASKAGLNKWTWWVPVATAFAIWWLGVSPVWIILGAIIGAVLYYILKLRKA